MISLTVGGISYMILYLNIIDKLKNAGYNTNRLRKEKLLSESVLQALRTNNHITTKSINTICSLLNCQPNDIIKYIPDEK